LYINGENKNTFTVTYDLANSAEMFYVGGPPLPPEDNVYFDGVIDEIRVSDVVRYSDNFTPPLEPFTPDANTRALWHFDEPICSTSFEDSSGNSNTLTGENGAHIGGELSVGDVSGNGYVTAYDASLALQHIVGLITLSPEQQQAADVTGNGTVTALDAALILQYTVGLITHFPVQQGAPVLTAKDENQILTKTIAEIENIPLTTEQKQVLEQLKHLIGQQSIPAHTALLQSYPNPFNPETWIPYELAQDASVTIRIYNVKGQLICVLHLGKKNASVYMTKDKAAHWDGKDSLGQSVASGLYFYTLQVEHHGGNGAGIFTATRKMVIMK